MKRKSLQNAQSEHNTAFAGLEELFAAEEYLINYNRGIGLNLVRERHNAKDVLEFGAGIGTLAKFWELETGVKPICLEIDPRLKTVIESKGFSCYDSLNAARGTFDVIYSSNVLEHIEEDLLTLKQLGSRIKNGGWLVIFVPAFQVLYSCLDERLGHYRRYNKQKLVQKLVESGFRVEEAYFFDSVGFFAWMYVKLTKRSSEKSFRRDMEFYDKYIYPVSRFFDKLGCKYLFGKNLYISAKKI